MAGGRLAQTRNRIRLGERDLATPRRKTLAIVGESGSG